MTLDKTFFYGVLLFTAGVFLAQKTVLPLLFIPAAGLSGLALTVPGLRQGRRGLSQAGFLLFFLAAGLLAATDANTPPPDSVFHLTGRRGVITGSVLPGSWRAQGAARASFILRAAAFSTPENTMAVSGQVRVFLRPSGNRLAHGALISVGGELSPILGLANPGGRDNAQIAARQDIYAALSARYEDIARADESLYHNSPAVFGARLKDGFADKLGRVLSPGDRSLIMSMLFGGYSGIDSGIIDAFSDAGLAHILSVSGAHVVLLAGFLGWLLKKCPISDKTAAIITIAFIWFYACLSALAVPALRAAGAATLVLSGRLFKRRADNGKILGGLLFLSLCYEPRWLFSVSWQLSFLAAGGLIYLYQPIKRRLDFLPDALAAGIAVSIAAQLAALPFLAGHFYQVSIVSLLANVFILPLLECCLILSLIGLAFLYILTPAAHLLFVLSGLGLGLAVRLTEFLAAQPFAVLTLPALPDWLWLCYYVLLATIFGWWPVSLPAKGQGILSAGIAALAVAAFCWPSARDGRLMVHFLDVGQGDAAIIITPRRKAVLIDTGGKSGGFDAGEQVVLPYLKHYGLKEIELLILSHGHNDHAGGAAAIIKGLPVRKIWLFAEDKDGDMKRAPRAAPEKTVLRAGLAAEVDGVRVETVFAPLYTARKKNRETSAVIKLTYQGHSFLFTGDLDAADEREIIPAAGKAAVLKVSHHGSAAASDPSFLAAVQPKIAVISVGRRNRYGHPAGETIERLRRQGCEIARTDEQGAVLAQVWRGKLYWHGYRHNPAAF